MDSENTLVLLEAGVCPTREQLSRQDSHSLDGYWLF